MKIKNEILAALTIPFAVAAYVLGFLFHVVRSAFYQGGMCAREWIES